MTFFSGSCLAQGRQRDPEPGSATLGGPGDSGPSCGARKEGFPALSHVWTQGRGLAVTSHGVFLTKDSREKEASARRSRWAPLSGLPARQPDGRQAPVLVLSRPGPGQPSPPGGGGAGGELGPGGRPARRSLSEVSGAARVRRVGLSLAAKARRQRSGFPLSCSSFGPYPGDGLTWRPTGSPAVPTPRRPAVHTQNRTRTRTPHAPRAHSALHRQPLRVGRETPGLVRTKRGQRSREAEAKGTRQRRLAGRGRLTEGPRGRRRSAGASGTTRSCFSQRAERGAYGCGAAVGTSRAGPEPREWSFGKPPPAPRSPRLTLGGSALGGREACLAGPGPGGADGTACVGRGPRGERPGRLCRGWAGGLRRRGRRERAATMPLRAALAASLQPGHRRGCRSRARRAAAPPAPTCPPRQPQPPAPRASQRMAPAAGARGARGLLGGAAAAGEGAGGGSTRLAGGTGWRQAGRAEPGARPRRSERESKTEDRAVRPGTVAAGPGCARRAGAEGSARA
ncbi:hypothetical protein AAY473_025577 [Plecturocebus cupreus]